MFLTRPNLQLLDKAQTRVFPIVNQNCHNSRASHDIDMRLGPATKLDKINTSASKQIGDGVMSSNCDVIVFFPIYEKSAAITF